jgi:hypothetical protein
MVPEGRDEVIRSQDAVRLVVTYQSRIETDVLWSFTIWTADHWVCVTGATSTQPERLTSGEGQLICRIPNLSLLAGAYTIRVGIMEFDTMLTVAHMGWDGPPAPLRVHGAPSLAANIGHQLNQLVTLDVEWSHPEAA